MVDVILPVVSSQGSIVMTPVADITRHNKSMLVPTDQGAALHPNVLL